MPSREAPSRVRTHVVHIAQQARVLVEHFLLQRGERFRVGRIRCLRGREGLIKAVGRHGLAVLLHRGVLGGLGSYARFVRRRGIRVYSTAAVDEMEKEIHIRFFTLGSDSE